MLFQAKENTGEAHKIRLSGVPNHLVEATGFEPAASASRTQRSTKLSHASISLFISHILRLQKLLYSFPCHLSTLFLKNFSKISKNTKKLF